MGHKNSEKSSNAISGMLWVFVERVSAQLITLIVSVILARLLTPEQYSIVAIVLIFILFANVFATSGFSSALIQKKNIDNIDYSTTFYFSLAFSSAFYIILYFLAPVISSFYNIPVLTLVIRILSLTIIFQSVNSIQQAYIAKTGQFKKFFLSTLLGTVSSAVVGIVMAYLGYGIWALVMQYLINIIINTATLLLISGWKPQFIFSLNRMKSLLSFGWKIMVADLIHKTVDQTRNILLTKFAKPTDLSFYNQGEKLPRLIITNIQTSMQKVLAPIVSYAQDDKIEVLNLTRKSIQISTFITWPILFGMFMLSNTIIELLYTSKWSASVPYLQIACLIYMIYPIAETNIRTIKAKGRSDLFLKIIIISQLVGGIFLVIFIIMKLSAIWIVSTWLISSFILALLAGIINIKLIGYKLESQISDFIKNGISCILMIIPIVLVNQIVSSIFYSLLIQIFIGVIVYGFSSFIINNKIFMYVTNIVYGYMKMIFKKNY